MKRAEERSKGEDEGSEGGNGGDWRGQIKGKGYERGRGDVRGGTLATVIEAVTKD